MWCGQHMEHLLSVDTANVMRLWQPFSDSEDGNALIHQLPKQTKRITTVCFSADGRLFASSSIEHLTVKVGQLLSCIHV